MTRSDDERSNPQVTGADGAQTGFQAHDSKDDHQTAYTTTPADDHVGAADHAKYTPVELPSAKVVTGQFDHLATRDVAAMDHALQVPEFEGAETVDGLGGELLDEVTPSAGLGVGASLGAAVREHHRDIDPNPGYTPPSEQGPPRVSQRPGDLPEGETPELQNEVQGDGLDRR
ncbi:hypothetical protein [uncultured Deinococcus sp.]|uniref:hypothetical protein n=1 Tax=uncultured Deinococcus sp. TaxID=158789 RepID=UPI0025D765F9|nr:hypothetical protein [uncultured Deinococcus sp.]